ncbi:MAG: hypothetical protein GC158_08290 [Cyanobacteria bacterium RI_101]|nr:hypothetical protein [Cyanobacteria bacterium RI_101]
MQLQKPLLLAALTAGATVGSLALAPSAQAITYTLSGVNFVVGADPDIAGSITGTISGSFDFDGTTYTNASLTSTQTSPASPNLWSGSATLVGGSSNSNFLLVQTAGSTTSAGFRSFSLTFSSPLTGNAGDTATLNTINSGLNRGNGSVNISGNITSGSATAVPLESDALPIVGSALFMAGGLWYKRRRAQAKANLDFLGVASEK